MSQNISFDPNDSALVLNSRRITNFSVGSFIELSPSDDVATVMKGLDGSSIANINRSVKYELTVSLIPNSDDFNYLQTLSDRGLKIDSTLSIVFKGKDGVTTTSMSYMLNGGFITTVPTISLNGSEGFSEGLSYVITFTQRTRL